MPVIKVDEKGRVVLPGEFRRKMMIRAGDEFIVEELGPDSLVLKRVNLRALMQDIIEKAKHIDMDKLETEIEEEANRLARQKYKIFD
jgi:AbrB family looped-hinge helix DNA binding protein